MLEIDTESFYRLAGVVGVVFYLLAYGLLQAGILRSSGYTYSLLNLIGSSLVLFSLIREFNLASALVNAFWIALSLFGLVRIFLMNHRIRFNDEETVMSTDVFTKMPRSSVRRLMNRGVWADWHAGLSLTTEGEPVTHLHYILSGSADVISGDRKIAEITRGLVGEMNVLEAGPASATVRTTETARIFTISGEALRRLVASDAEMRFFIEHQLGDATKRKLIEANARLSGQVTGAADAPVHASAAGR